MFEIPGYTTDTASGWLAQKELLGVVESLNSRFLSSFPLLSLFEQKVRWSKEFLVKQLVELLLVGRFTAKSQYGDRVDPYMFSQKQVEPFFQQHIIDLSDDQALGLINYERLQGQPFLSDSLDQFLTDFRRAIAARIRIQKRTIHLHIAKALSTPGGFNETISGTTVAFDWGFGQWTYTNDWRTSTTNVAVEFMDAIDQFIRNNEGLKPNTIVTHRKFHQAFILPNEELRLEFGVRNLGMLADFLVPREMYATEDQLGPYKTILMSDMYIDPSDEPADGTASDLSEVWPENIMLLAHVDHGEGNFIMNTCKTLDNDGRGGQGITAFKENNPPSWHVRVSDNGIPTFADPRRCQICTLSAT